MKRLFWLALLFPALTFSQVQKCTIEGKTVYSDSLCGQRGQAVNTDANSLDTSGLRDLAEQQRQRDAAEKAKMAEANARPKGGRPDPCAGIKPIDRVGTKAELEAMRRCMAKRRQ